MALWGGEDLGDFRSWRSLYQLLRFVLLNNHEMVVGTNLSPNLKYIAVANIFRIHFGY